MGKENFLRTLPAIIVALLILGAIIGYSIYKKRKGFGERPAYIPIPTNIPPLSPALIPEPTGILPLGGFNIPEPTGILPLGGEIKNIVSEPVSL